MNSSQRLVDFLFSPISPIGCSEDYISRISSLRSARAPLGGISPFAQSRDGSRFPEQDPLTAASSGVNPEASSHLTSIMRARIYSIEPRFCPSHDLSIFSQARTTGESGSN